MCFVCEPEKLAGQFVQGNGFGDWFKQVSKKKDSIYRIEEVKYEEYGKLYNFCLKSLPDENVHWIRNVRRGTFYNHFNHITKVPESIFESMKESLKQRRRYLREYIKEMKASRERMEKVSQMIEEANSLASS